MIPTKKPFVKAILLILASDNLPVYQEFRKIYQEYLYSNPNIKVFFVYGNQHTFEPQEYDLIYDDVEENYYPGMITKTIKAMEFIDKNYEYEFLVRTNLSTFWDFDRLLSRLDKQPKQKCVTGTLRQCKYKGKQSPLYVAGVNLVLSNDMVKEIIKHKEEMCNWDLPEDWALSQIFINMSITPRASLPGAIHFMDKFQSFNEEEVLREINKAREMNHDNFRIKNARNREDVDIKVAKVLLREYYGKTIL